MVDVVICRSLDTKFLSRGLDSEVRHDERRLWSWKRANIVRVLEEIKCLVQSFSSKMRNTRIWLLVFSFSCLFTVGSCLWRRVLQTSGWSAFDGGSFHFPRFDLKGYTWTVEV